MDRHGVIFNELGDANKETDRKRDWVMYRHGVILNELGHDRSLTERRLDCAEMAIQLCFRSRDPP